MAKSTLDLQSTEGMTNEAGLKLEILIIGRWNRWPMSGSNFNLSKSGTIQWRIYSSDLLFRCCVERLRPDSRWLVNTSFPGYSIRRWMSVIGHFQLRRSVINVNPSCGRHFFCVPCVVKTANCSLMRVKPMSPVIQFYFDTYS